MSDLYWLLRLPALQNLLFICAFSSAMLAIACSMLTLAMWVHDEDYLLPMKGVKILISSTLIFSVLTILCPSKQDLAIMLGWDAIKSESVQEVVELLKERYLK